MERRTGPEPAEGFEERTAGPAEHERRTTVVVIVLLVAYMLGFGAIAFWAIGDRRPHWQYGSSPYIPAQTYTTTAAPPPAAAAPKQVELPPPTIRRKGK